MGSVSLLHDLKVHSPRRELSLIDRIEQILSRAIRVGLVQLGSLLRAPVLDSLVGLEVPLDQMGLTLGIDQLQGVGRESVHVAVTCGGTTVGEQDSNLVEGFVGERDEIPEGISVLQIRLGIALLGVDKVRELDRVATAWNGWKNR